MAGFASQGKAFIFFLSISFLLLVLVFYSTYKFPSFHRFHLFFSGIKSTNDVNEGCNGLHRLESDEEKCGFVISTSQCNPEGYINYLHLFYCICGKFSIVGYIILVFWLVCLFYLLGNTAASYFCSNLEGLSRLWKLSPTIAGVTLLSLGNGAPDVFSSIVSFKGTVTSTNLVGLNCVLGGVFFISSIVVGVISICTSKRKITIDKSCFVRDVCFLLLILSVLTAILVVGKVNLWISIAFSSLYLAYVFLVSMTHLFGLQREPILHFDSDPLLPTKGELGAPLLDSIGKGGETKPELFRRIIYFLELPLYLPRRLTIPDISEERWSKTFAVLSVTLSPVLLAVLWDSKREEFGSEKSVVIYLFGGVMGIIFGTTVFSKTDKERPPTRFLFPWLAGGFLMSVTWTYILAEELVSLLVSLGVILNISPSMLALTVLAWGNSLGDLIANVAVALNGGPGGAQVAMSGCYGGPIFNTLVGLGISFVLSSWAEYPHARVIPKDPSLFQTLGFLFAGLLWALVVLPRRGMKPDRVLGAGLICIYLCFLCLSCGQALGLIQRQ